VSEEILMVHVMEEMGRSYTDYVNTPQRVIDVIIGKKNLDSKASDAKRS